MLIEERQHLHQTHEVKNQPKPLENYNLYLEDQPLREAIQRHGADWMEDRLRAFGQHIGRAEFLQLGDLANRFSPVLQTHDRFGNRRDEVEFHPAYHELMRASIKAEMHALPWNHPRAGAHVARAATHYLLSQVEAGVGCPITMSFASVPALRLQPEIADEWVPRVTSTKYDQRVIPASQKTGSMIGMAMTEKQGGSDVRANDTRAVPIGAEGPGQEYLLTGHKWFVSGIMADAFLATAHTENGLTCFFVPKFLPDGTKNRFFMLRLKDKVGNRSNATGEVELLDTWARMVGDEGRGVPTIIEMVNHTRLDCAIGMASVMRQALTQAIHNCAHRAAFGNTLLDQPLMQNVLADLALESEAATTLMMRMAQAYDDLREDPKTRHFTRMVTAVGKYWISKRAPHFVFECMECLGGSGYVEECNMPRLYREAPVCAIWEGSGNVISLDMLRALHKDPATLPAFLAELDHARGGDKRLDAFLDKLSGEFEDLDGAEPRARRIMEKLALALQASLLMRFAPDYVADAFIASRIAGDHGNEYGTLPKNTAFRDIIDRVRPKAE